MRALPVDCAAFYLGQRVGSMDKSIDLELGYVPSSTMTRSLAPYAAAARNFAAVLFLVLLSVLLPAQPVQAALRCPRAQEATQITVKAGESVLRLALRHNVTIPQIEKWNPKLERDKVREGQKLWLCLAPSADSSLNEPPSHDANDGDSEDDTPDGSSSDSPSQCSASERQVTHVVKSGETLGSLSQAYGLKESTIVRQNPDLSPAKALKVGLSLELCLPRGKKGQTAKECAYQTPIHRHEVVPGEVITQIAARYGVRTADILKLNPKLARNADLIRVGQELKICPDILPRERVKISHAVVQGETLSEIAENYGLTPKELIRFQQGKLANPNNLQIGQTLIVWRDGAIVRGFGRVDDNRGILKGGQVLRPGVAFTTKSERLSWGTATTVRLIKEAIVRYKTRFAKGPKVHVGDISLARGGKFSPHVSHQTGHDVDVGYVLLGDSDQEGTRFITANKTNLDVARSWGLIKAFLDSGQVRYIFMDYQVQRLLYDHALKHGVRESLLEELFQYPRGKARHYGIIRHSKGHVNHFHVRFRH